jgi:RNA polymerase sigma-70 factor (ECF subfamily)
VTDRDQKTTLRHDEATPTLIIRLREGDSGAADLLDRLYRDAIHRFCFGYLASHEEAEDAVQDVFCKVLATDQVPEQFRPWLYRVARNHCLNILRTRARRREGQALPPESRLDASWTGNLTRLVKRELRSRIGHLVAALPVASREVLQLRYTEGLSRAEIADVVGVSESIVKSRLYEGIKRLRDEASMHESTG